MRDIIKQVTWNDAALAENKEESGLVETKSVGFLVEKNKDYIKIAQSKRLDTNEYEDILTIPRKWIKRMVVK